MESVREKLRKNEKREDEKLIVGNYKLKKGKKIIIDEKGRKIRIKEKEEEIIKYIYREGEKVIGRDVMIEEVWG